MIISPVWQLWAFKATTKFVGCESECQLGRREGLKKGHLSGRGHTQRNTEPAVELGNLWLDWAHSIKIQTNWQSLQGRWTSSSLASTLINTLDPWRGASEWLSVLAFGELVQWATEICILFDLVMTFWKTEREELMPKKDKDVSITIFLTESKVQKLLGMMASPGTQAFWRRISNSS